ncbi:hypothetical protein HMPREF3192_01087 [Atopobium deltae]|uniref:Uncharacterized protein n=1 Tax=Atopobium deltae TaxID=1393034 RepID=A0A133XSE6_9ACTN|nr:hypothetical protein HMPREF3192_01087 [Atopobium deltae]
MLGAKLMIRRSFPKKNTQQDTSGMAFQKTQILYKQYLSK